ncbi:MAG: hypothetical protein AB8G26_00255 [Ilumatobacter sp.]
MPHVAQDFEDFADVLLELRHKGPMLSATGIGVSDAITLGLVSFDDETTLLRLTPQGFAEVSSREERQRWIDRSTRTATRRKPRAADSAIESDGVTSPER